MFHINGRGITESCNRGDACIFADSLHAQTSDEIEKLYQDIFSLNANWYEYTPEPIVESKYTKLFDEAYGDWRDIGYERTGKLLPSERLMVDANLKRANSSYREGAEFFYPYKILYTYTPAYVHYKTQLDISLRLDYASGDIYLVSCVVGLVTPKVLGFIPNFFRDRHMSVSKVINFGNDLAAALIALEKEAVTATTFHTTNAKQRARWAQKVRENSFMNPTHVTDNSTAIVAQASEIVIPSMSEALIEAREWNRIHAAKVAGSSHKKLAAAGYLIS